jgi:putative Mg2+ transporter-C (MgtC) family protein
VLGAPVFPQYRTGNKIMTGIEFTMRISAAVLLGALIGLERQWRQRMAGLRTNALVSTGAAAFVAISMLLPGENDSTRISAQIVSGIGFLGAGVIFREGFNVRGLNTAATLWCSAAIGTLSGLGFVAYAAITTCFVLGANIFLRPVARKIDSQPSEVATEIPVAYRLQTVCQEKEEQHIRALLLNSIANEQLSLRAIRSEDMNGSSKVKVEADLTTTGRCDKLIEQIINRLSLEPSISGISWETVGDEVMILE